MANLLNQNPIILTGTQTSYKAAVAASLGANWVLRVTKIYWYNPIIAGDVALIIDPASGQNLERLRCEAANQSQIIDWSANPKIWRDFAVVQLDSGILEIHTV